MKKLFIIRVPAILVILTLLFIIPVNAQVDSTLQNDCAKALVRLKLLQGYSDGSLKLQDRIKRSEFITLTVKMSGYDKITDAGTGNLPFKDITSKHWAYNYIKVALKKGLVSGYPDNTIAPDKYVTYAEALTVLVKVLGYESALKGTWPDNVVTEAAQLGLNKNAALPNNKQITRGEMAVLVYNALTADLK